MMDNDEGDGNYATTDWLLQNITKQQYLFKEDDENESVVGSGWDLKVEGGCFCVCVGG